MKRDPKYLSSLMKTSLIPLIVILAVSLACGLNQALPILPSPTPTLTDTPAPPTDTPTPTQTPTPIPTPTPLPGARIAAGDHAIFNGDWDTAQAAFQSALDASSDPEIQGAALVGLGRVLYLTSDYPNALNTFRKLIDTYPNSPHLSEAYFLLGETYEKLNRNADAADAFLKYLALRPGILDSYVLERMGDDLFAGGDFASALIDYQSALKSARLGSYIPVEVKLARCYAITGDAATALVMYDDIFKHSSSDYTKAEVDFLEGQTYAAIGQVNQSQAAYLDAVVNFPTSYDSYSALVELVNASYPVDEFNRGLVDYFAGQYNVALQAFDRYLKGNPSDPARAYYYKGLTLRAQEDYTDTITAWDVVIHNYPNSAVWDKAWEQKAYTLWAYQDKFPEAQATLTDFVASAPTHPRAAEFLFDAAQVAERAGNLTEAAALWQRVVNEYPLSSYTYRALFLAGIADYRQGDYQSAQVTFERVQSVASDITQRSAAFFWSGKTDQARGDQASALAAWQQAAQIDPTGYYSERAQDLILGRAPFTTPTLYDLGIDWQADRQQAEAWMAKTFNLPEGTDLSGPGELSNDPGFQRGQEFWRLGLYDEANSEFNALCQSIQNDPANNYRLANYLVDLGAYYPAVYAARQVLTLAGMDDAAMLNAPALFNHIRFGPYFADLVIPLAQKYGFHPLLVWSLMKQESGFERSILSSAGARGLMQFIPSTAQDVAKRLEWPANFSLDDLDRPQVSITFGLYYLDSLRTYEDGDLYAALAAYNGGPGNASVWKSLAANDPDLFLEVIRLEEPQHYITGIYEIYNIYRKLYERTP